MDQIILIIFKSSTINEIESENKVGNELQYEDVTFINNCSNIFLVITPLIVVAEQLFS